MQCPKCAYVRQPTDSAPGYECPKCGIVYAKYDPLIEERRKSLAERRSKPALPADERVPKTGTPNDSTTSCRICGGIVSWAAKTCPHCGQGKPAGKRANVPMRPWARKAMWAVALLVVIGMFLDGGGRSTSTQPARYTLKIVERTPFTGTALDIDAMSSYGVILGRAIACGVETEEASRRVGKWMNSAGASYTRAMMEGIAWNAQQQKAGRSPDSCTAVRQGFAGTVWP